MTHLLFKLQLLYNHDWPCCVCIYSPEVSIYPYHEIWYYRIVWPSLPISQSTFYNLPSLGRLVTGKYWQRLKKHITSSYQWSDTAVRNTHFHLLQVSMEGKNIWRSFIWCTVHYSSSVTHMIVTPALHDIPGQTVCPHWWQTMITKTEQTAGLVTRVNNLLGRNSLYI